MNDDEIKDYWEAAKKILLEGAFRDEVMAIRSLRLDQEWYAFCEDLDGES